MAVSDLLGLVQLGAEATAGIAGVAEALHGAIHDTLGLPGPRQAGRTAGLTGFVYRSVRGVAGLTGRLARGAHAASAAAGAPPALAASPARRDALVAVLNGVWGDHLALSGNPLAIRMALRSGGHTIAPDTPALTAWLQASRPAHLGKPQAPLPEEVVVLIHGLCMNDRQWRHRHHDHGRMLAEGGQRAVLYLHYNSGRSVHLNGRDLSDLLEALVRNWPGPLRRLSLVAHSMGGLVARSACLAGARAGQTWPGVLQRLICLGTPHHGAPLERGGRLVDRALGWSRYAAPFARLGLSRSAGIHDLAHGHVQERDGQPWDDAREAPIDQGQPPSADLRRAAPLPTGVMTCLVAARMGESPTRRRDSLQDRWVGDGLVPLASALGEHPDPRLALAGIPTGQRLVVDGADHWDLLSHPEVSRALRAWFDELTPPPSAL